MDGIIVADKKGDIKPFVCESHFPHKKAILTLGPALWANDEGSVDATHPRGDVLYRDPR
jgi:hypothetical protein